MASTYRFYHMTSTINEYPLQDFIETCKDTRFFRNGGLWGCFLLFSQRAKYWSALSCIPRYVYLSIRKEFQAFGLVNKEFEGGLCGSNQITNKLTFGITSHDGGLSYKNNWITDFSTVIKTLLFTNLHQNRLELKIWRVSPSVRSGLCGFWFR